MKYKTLTLLGALAFSQLSVSCSKKQTEGTDYQESASTQNEQKKSMSDSGDSYEAVSDDIVKMVETMIAALSMAKDEESANSAVTKLNDLADKANSYAERLESLGKPDAEQAKLVNEKMKKVQEEMNKEMMTTMGNIMQNPEVAAIIQKGLLEFAEKTAPMEKISKEYFENAQ